MERAGMSKDVSAFFLHIHFNPRSINAEEVCTMLGVVLPPDQTLNVWRYVLDAEKAGTTNLKRQLSITDIKETWILEMRNSILEIKQGQINDTPPVLETTVAQLNAFHNKGEEDNNFMGAKEGVAVLKEMMSYLDSEVLGVYMHLR